MAITTPLEMRDVARNSVPIIDLVQQRGLRGCLQAGINRQHNVIARDGRDGRLQIAKYLPSHIHLHDAQSICPDQNIIQRKLPRPSSQPYRGWEQSRVHQ
ncbi:MAG: hypothetical protein MZV70_21230 [Desulfobacterales bacterium]|nr:hypothetical protein [Desulfobacterales bacterium]